MKDFKYESDALSLSIADLKKEVEAKNIHNIEIIDDLRKATETSYINIKKEADGFAEQIVELRKETEENSKQIVELKVQIES